ncbi:hypothetical protein H4219_002425 [Mycoemilia scoparia]|uniref:alpha-1,2-Mannosidase n=1 Tax=Mycoemilia scoparia TaxID=417184 RepID=A0A9W8A5J4_9FUNG|nr:hypothetical protein H4219_002425 [Mycoemilia scoparia]
MYVDFSHLLYFCIVGNLFLDSIPLSHAKPLAQSVSTYPTSAVFGLDGLASTSGFVQQCKSRKVQSSRFHGLLRTRDASSRAEDVKKGFLHAWNAYQQNTFGADEIDPMTLEPKTTRNGWGATMVDGLDTLWIMGLHDQFDAVKEKVAKLNFRKGGGQLAKVFETNIRYVGGLISAYELSNDDVFLKKAKELADVLMDAFDTPTGVPWQMLEVETGKGSSEGGSGSSNNLAEIGSYQMEFFRLSQLTKDPKYHQAAQKVIDVILKNKPGEVPSYNVDGLYPTGFDTMSGKFTGGKASWGALGDSFYEYLIKTWYLSDFGLKRNLDMWNTSFDAFQKHIATKGVDDRMYMGLSDGKDFTSIQDTFTCFAPGTIALAGKLLDQKDSLDLAIKLGEACYNTFSSMPTNLGAESIGFLPKGSNPNYSGLSSTERDQVKKHGFYNENASYLLRPEVIESIFYLHRITGDSKYQEWAWNIWNGIKKNCKVDGGYVGIKNVQGGKSSGIIPNQESFVFAETFKYLYLIFSPSEISLDDYVFTTEAHPFKRNIPFNGSFS